MRLPTVRLPALSFDWARGMFSRTTVLYVAFTAVLFVVFLVLTFPHDLLVRRALSAVNRGPVTVDFETVSLSLRGYDVAGIRVGADDAPPYLECSHLWIRPSLAALVRGNLHDFVVSADLYGGEASGDVSLDSSFVGGVQWRGLDLSRYRALTALLDDGRLSGKVSGQFTFETRRDNVAVGQGSGEFAIEGVGLAAAKINGLLVPDVRVRQVKGKFSVGGGHVSVQDVQTTGDLNLQGAGQITFKDPIGDSALNLRATITTGLETPDAIKTLVGLIPRAPGAKPDAPFTVTGTLASPRVR